MKRRIAMLSLLIFGVAVVPAQADPARLSSSSVYRFSDGSTVMGATSQLVRTAGAASFTIRTSGLTVGDAVTVWWVVFNNPSACTQGQPPFRCGIGDLLPFGGDPAVQSSAFYAAGHVIGGNGAGNYGGHTSTEGPQGEVLWGPGLTNALGADIHFVVRTHGPALPEFLPGQIQSFGVGCSNAPPFTGPNVCEDLQFAVHES